MIGLTTRQGLQRLCQTIAQTLNNTSVNYTVSPFVGVGPVISASIHLLWILVNCVWFSRYPVAILANMILFALNLLLLFTEIYLSKREKLDAVRNVFQKLEESIENVNERTFYLKDNYPSNTSVGVTRVYRDGSIVTIGMTLLVEGDIIVLSPGQAAPVACKSTDTGVELRKGDIYERDNTPYTGSKPCIIVQPKVPGLFTVSITPYTQFLQTFLTSSRPTSKLSLEISRLLEIVQFKVSPAVIFISISLAFIRGYIFETSFAAEIEAVLVTVLPLLPLVYTAMFLILNYTSTALVLLSVKQQNVSRINKISEGDYIKTPEDDKKHRVKGGTPLIELVRNTWFIIAGRSYNNLPRQSNVFQTLSSVSVLCSVNKEGILSHPHPNIERVMLLDPEGRMQMSNEKGEVLNLQKTKGEQSTVDEGDEQLEGAAESDDTNLRGTRETSVDITPAESTSRESFLTEDRSVSLELRTYNSMEQTSESDEVKQSVIPRVETLEGDVDNTGDNTENDVISMPSRESDHSISTHGFAPIPYDSEDQEVKDDTDEGEVLDFSCSSDKPPTLMSSLPNIHLAGYSTDEDRRKSEEGNLRLSLSSVGRNMLQCPSLRLSLSSVAEGSKMHELDTLKTLLPKHKESVSSEEIKAYNIVPGRSKIRLNSLSKFVVKGYSKLGNDYDDIPISDTPEESGAESPLEGYGTPRTEKKKRKAFWKKIIHQRYRPVSQEVSTEHPSKVTEEEVEDEPREDEDKEELRSLNEKLQSEAIKANQLDEFVVLLNLSLYKQSAYGLRFDRADWMNFMSSLKPLGLAILLNNSCSMGCSVTSHLNHISVDKKYGFKLPLPTDYCYCVLGREIGFTRYALHQYDKISNLITYVPHDVDGNRCTQRCPADGMLPLTCLISTVVRDKQTSLNHIFSYGTASLVLKCCYNMWDGQDLQVLLPEYRMRIQEFYNQNRLTSHCFVLAYRPLVCTNDLPSNTTFLSLPKGTNFLDEYATEPPDTAENILQTQVGQIFLGVVCAQFQPRHDVVTLIERLEAGNIRFVHFSYDNELRSRAFGTKLGLETGWNCHISLAEDDYDNFSIGSDEDLFQDGFHPSLKARLPQGIKNIKPHLDEIDNVPLLVPLFTSCTSSANYEMIRIMQDHEEIVCCLGSTLQSSNIQVFCQADSSVGVIPLLPQQCLSAGIQDMTLPWPSNDFFTPPTADQFLAPNCLHICSLLNTLPCCLVMSRDHVFIEPLLNTARDMSMALKQTSYLTVSMYAALCFFCLVHQMLLLPPPLSIPLAMLMCVFAIPLLSFTPYTLHKDEDTMTLHTGKRGPILEDIIRHSKYFVIRWSMLFTMGPLNTVLVLKAMCGSRSECGGVSTEGADNSTEGHPWPRYKEDTIMTMQHFNAASLAITLSLFSLCFSHRTHKLNKRFLQRSITRYTLLLPLTVFMLAFVVILVSAILEDLDFVGVPVYSFVIAITIPFLVQLVFSELSKAHDRRLFSRYQRREKLKFGTKLGMNSPF